MERPKKGTQAERLLNWMEAGHKVTPLDSWELLGIYRLSDVVFKLRRNYGYNIITDSVDVPNKYGETVTVGEYELVMNEPEMAFSLSNTVTQTTGGTIYQDTMFKIR